MESLQIALANGDTTQADKLRSYFDKVLKAEDSGEDYPCHLEHVWKVGYTTKGNAVKTLRRNYKEGVDFEVLIQVDKNPLGGRPEEIYKLSVSCLEHFVVRANRAVFEVYRACRQAVRRMLLPNFSDPVAAARAWADEREAKQIAEAEAQKAQLLLMEAQPAVETMQALTDSGECLSMAEVAKTLAIPDLGRNNLYDLLRDAQIIQPMPSTEPYQRYVNEGYFKRVQVPYERQGEKRLGHKTVVTPRGVLFIKRLVERRAK